MGALNVLALVLAIRMTVFASVVGGIILSAIALWAPDPYRVGTLAIYCMAVVAPCIWLASRRG